MKEAPPHLERDDDKVLKLHMLNSILNKLLYLLQPILQ